MILTFIKDKISGVPLPEIIPSVNEVVAVYGFKKWIEDKESKQKGISEYYSLFKCGEIGDDFKILNTDYQCICEGSKVEETFNELFGKAQEA